MRLPIVETWKKWDIPPPVIALLLAVGLFLLGGILRPGFANPSQAINIVRLAAFLGIIAAGQTLVIISGGEGIDLSAGAIVTLEQHSVIGGLGSAVAEVLAELPGARVPFRRVGVPSAFSARVGSQKWLERQHGLDEAGVLAQVEALLSA